MAGHKASVLEGKERRHGGEASGPQCHGAPGVESLGFVDREDAPVAQARVVPVIPEAESLPAAMVHAVGLCARGHGTTGSRRAVLEAQAVVGERRHLGAPVVLEAGVVAVGNGRQLGPGPASRDAM